MSEVFSVSTLLQAEIEQSKRRLEEKIQTFLQKNSIHYIVALIGDSETTGPIAERNLAILHDFFTQLKNREAYAIQTGGTEGGIPELGCDTAQAFGVATVGIYPAAARKYALQGDKAADFVIETPDIWYGKTSFGAETPMFVQTLHGAVVIGGSYGTRTEISTMLRTNKSRARSLASHPDDTSLPQLIQLCPITGTGKSADEIASATPYDTIGDCLPSEPITNGAQAAKFINERLTA